MELEIHFCLYHSHSLPFRSLGIPLIVVVGQKAVDEENPLFELHFTNTDTTVELPLTDLIQEILKWTQSPRT